MPSREYEYMGFLSNRGMIYVPVVDIILNIEGNPPLYIDAIIDSGTDETLMSYEVALGLGINPDDYGKDSEPVIGILGHATESFSTYVTLIVDGFEDNPLTIKPTFVLGMKTHVLLGQQDFFKNFDILFQMNKKKFILTLI